MVVVVVVVVRLLLPPSLDIVFPARPPSLMWRRSTWSVGHYSARAHEQKARLIAVVKASGPEQRKGPAAAGGACPTILHSEVRRLKFIHRS